MNTRQDYANDLGHVEYLTFLSEKEGLNVALERLRVLRSTILSRDFLDHKSQEPLEYHVRLDVIYDAIESLESKYFPSQYQRIPNLFSQIWLWFLVAIFLAIITFLFSR